MQTSPNKAARHDMLAQAPRDSSRAKRLSSKALAGKLAKLDPQPDFELPLYDHQAVGFLLGLDHPGYFLQYDMGLGKSAVAITLFRYRRKLREASRMLVLVRQVSQLPGWVEEIAKHAPELEVVTLDSKVPAAKRRAAYAGGPEVVVTTYAGLRAHISNGKPEAPEAIAALAEQFQALTLDESTECGNPKSKIWAHLDALTALVPYRLALSGTPWTANPMALWGQFWLVDRGETLGHNQWRFRSAFFRQIKVPFGAGHIWKFVSATATDLHRLMQHGAIRYEESECLDLPATVGGLADPMIRSSPMGPEQVQHMDGLWDALEEARGTDDRVNVYNDMRRISSGYVMTELGSHEFKANPKYEALATILEECGAHKLIVFCHYRETVEIVSRRLTKAKYKVATVYGGTGDVEAELAAFKAKAQILVCNGAASFGLNLQHCSRTVFFETPPLIERRQAEKRTHRNGQTETTFFWDLLVRGTLDARVLAAQRDGKSLQDIVVDGRRRL